MEDNITNTHAGEKSQKLNPLLITAVIAAVIVVGGVGVIGLGKNSNQTVPVAATQKLQTAQPTATDTTAEVEGATDTAPQNSEVNTISVAGGNFYFKPNEIRVKKGEKVKIALSSKDGIHDFVIDDFDVKSPRISDDNTTSVEFTPDKTGTFEFYCSVGQHRAMGMKGNLIVE